MNNKSIPKSLTVRAFGTERFIIIIKTPGSRNKVMQIMLHKRDGSIFVNFPYYRFKQGLVSLVTFPANISLPTSLSLEPGGKVTSHLVKFTHHVDGHAHFSQDGRVLTVVKKHSIPLAVAEGHIFTAQLQGMSDYEVADPKQDFGYSLKKTFFEFNFTEKEPEAIKILGYWYSLSSLVSRFRGQVPDTIGPTLPCVTDSNKKSVAVLVENPYLKTKEKYLLMIMCEAMPMLDKDSISALTFIGGFDPPKIVHDQTRDTTFLAISYPAHNYSELKQRIGSIDFLRL